MIQTSHPDVNTIPTHMIIPECYVYLVATSHWTRENNGQFADEIFQSIVLYGNCYIKI